MWGGICLQRQHGYKMNYLNHYILSTHHTSPKFTISGFVQYRSRFQGFATVAALVEKFSLSALPAVSKVTHILAPYLPKDDVSKHVITVKWLQIEPESYEALKQTAELQGDITLASPAMHSICTL
jgi:hypothetical protein